MTNWVCLKCGHELEDNECDAHLETCNTPGFHLGPIPKVEDRRK